MAYFHEHTDGHCTLVLSWSRFNVRECHEAEKNAKELKAAAIELSGIEHFPPVLFGFKERDIKQAEADHWWSECFGLTERELQEQETLLAKRYKKTAFWKRQKRRAMLIDFIRIHEMLTVGHGLTTIWR